MSQDVSASCVILGGELGQRLFVMTTYPLRPWRIMLKIDNYLLLVICMNFQLHATTHSDNFQPPRPRGLTVQVQLHPGCTCFLTNPVFHHSSFSMLFSDLQASSFHMLILSKFSWKGFSPCHIFLLCTCSLLSTTCAGE